MRQNFSTILAAALFVGAGFMAGMSMADAQDEPGMMSVVLSDEPLVISSGEGQLSSGKAAVQLSRSFCDRLDSTKPVRCIISGTATGYYNATEERLKVDGPGEDSFSWIVIGSAKPSRGSHR